MRNVFKIGERKKKRQGSGKEKGNKLDKGQEVCELLLDLPGMRNICFPGSTGYV